MAIYMLTNVRTLIGGLEITSLSNSASVSIDVADLDVTTFGSSGTRARIAGLRDSTFTAAGFVDPAEAVDAAQFTGVGVSQTLMVLPTGGALAEPAWFGSQLQGSYQTGARVGEVMPFTVNYATNGAFPRGKVLVPSSSAITTSTTGSGVQLGAVPAGSKLYAQVQCTARTGSISLAIDLESATSNAFSSTTTRASFATVNAVGANSISPVAGSITDTWWRANITATGTGSATIVIAAAIATV